MIVVVVVVIVFVNFTRPKHAFILLVLSAEPSHKMALSVVLNLLLLVS